VPFSRTFTTTFTVSAVNIGSSFAGDPPTVGDVTTSTAVIDCDQTTCTIASPESPFNKGFLKLDLIYTPDHFEGSRVDAAALNPCPELGDSQLSTKIDLQRDATGKVVRFTGTNVLFHPSGVEAQKAGGGNCATFDVTTTFVGIPA
jgi:hypothetical protein